MLKMILALHIAGGSIALMSMFVPMAVRKGGAVHRRAGWVFVAAMTVVSVTALLLAGARILSDARPDARSFAAFLFYVGILTGAGVSSGIRALQTKSRTGPHHGMWDIGISSVLLAAAVGMMVYGVATGRALFVAFASIGLIGGVTQLRYWLRPPSQRMHWWFEHMSGMLGACIAATTAFLVLNSARIGLAQYSLLVWLAPTVVGVPAIAIWTAYYRRRFTAAPAVRRDTSLPALSGGPYTPSRSA